MVHLPFASASFSAAHAYGFFFELIIHLIRIRQSCFHMNVNTQLKCDLKFNFLDVLGFSSFVMSFLPGYKIDQDLSHSLSGRRACPTV